MIVFALIGVFSWVWHRILIQDGHIFNFVYQTPDWLDENTFGAVLVKYLRVCPYCMSGIIAIIYAITEYFSGAIAYLHIPLLTCFSILIVKILDRLLYESS